MTNSSRKPFTSRNVSSLFDDDPLLGELSPSKSSLPSSNKPSALPDTKVADRSNEFRSNSASSLAASVAAAKKTALPNQLLAAPVTLSTPVHSSSSSSSPSSSTSVNTRDAASHSLHSNTHNSSDHLTSLHTLSKSAMSNEINSTPSSHISVGNLNNTTTGTLGAKIPIGSVGVHGLTSAVSVLEGGGVPRTGPKSLFGDSDGYFHGLDGNFSNIRGSDDTNVKSSGGDSKAWKSLVKSASLFDDDDDIFGDKSSRLSASLKNKKTSNKLFDD